jgi:nicotinate-nucleotide adenylyltransferase
VTSRLGIFGGTFDPIHLGHLRAAENARESLGLDSVLLVAAGTPPHRPPARASALDRFAMVCLAASEHPAFVAVDDEIRRQGPSYTVDTVSAIADRFPDSSLHLILGSDALSGLPSWRSPERLLSLCRVAVIARPGGAPLHSMPAPHDVIAGPGLEVSATVLRERAAAGQSLRFLVTDPVARYIERKRLYR